MGEYPGIYRLTEVSKYLFATAPSSFSRYDTIRRWARSGAVISETSLLDTRAVVLSFEELVSLRMVISLRLAGFSLQHIRKVHQWLEKDVTHYPRPFALKDLWVSTTEIFIEMEGFLLSASKKGQIALEFIKEWLLQIRRPDIGPIDLTFEEYDGKQRASSWTPHPHVMLNPRIQFGAPCIEGTRIPTNSVWGMHLAGEADSAIAKDYKLSIDKVRAALEWERKIEGIAA